MKELMLDIVRQIFGWSKPREGGLVFTRYSYNKMNEYELDAGTLQDVYKTGKEVKRGMIIKKYTGFHIGIVVNPDINTDRPTLITCWKRRNM